MKREFALSTPLSQISERLNNNSNLGLVVESVSTGNYRIFKDEPVGFFKHGIYSLSCTVSSSSNDETRVQLKGRMNVLIVLFVISGMLPLFFRTNQSGWQDPLLVGILMATPLAMWLIYRAHINSLVKKVKAFLEG